MNNVTVDMLVDEMTPKARGECICKASLLRGYDESHYTALVPDYVKKELLQHIREYIEKNT